ncbi:MAG: hypothetical protein K2M87_05915 [Muribaculaceae bacterium]|nr:hypothetical protein [Muribaculaceae bacterium]
MLTFLIILAVALWLCSLWCLYGRQLIAPALSYCALLVLSFAKTSAGFRLLPLNATILTVWLAISLVVMIAVILQSEPMRRQTRGMTWIIAGAITGMIVGLVPISSTFALSTLYTTMICGTLAGTALGFLVYTTTRSGEGVKPGSGHFFQYLLAKGFPTAITVMMLGVALVLLLAMNNVNAL